MSVIDKKTNIMDKEAQDKLENGYYTHIGLMLRKLENGVEVFSVVAYNSDKECQNIESVFGERDITRALIENIKKYNLIDDGLMVNDSFDVIDISKEVTLEKQNILHNLQYYSAGIFNLNIHSDILIHLEEVERSFAVERDLKSGSMLIQDQEKLDGIMNMRLTGLKSILSSGGTDNLLAAEMVYLYGGEKNRSFLEVEASVKDPIKRANAIDRVLTIPLLENVIDCFNDIRNSSQEYKSGIEYTNKMRNYEGSKELNINSDGVVEDSCWKDLAALSKYLEKKIGSASGLEAAVFSERHKIVDNLIFDYQRLQEEVLQPEKETTKTKQAGVELAV